jgi:serine/threonine protein kinase
MAIIMFFVLLLFRLIVSSFQLIIELITNYFFSIIGDLKPENLLLTSKENDAILKLTDFGFAKEGRKRKEYIHYRSFFLKETISCNHCLLQSIDNDEQGRTIFLNMFSRLAAHRSTQHQKYCPIQDTTK